MRPSKPGHFRVSLSTPAPPGPPAAGLLTPSDFVYLGSYDVQTNGDFTNLAQGLAGRNVGGDFRLLSFQHGFGGRLDELSLAGRAFGSLITTPTRTWSNIGGFGVAGDHKGFFYDEAMQRLWTNACQSYTADLIPTQIYTRTLNDNGTVSNLRGPISLHGVGAKQVFGGAAAIPSWFQQQYGVGPYCVGWGGGTSLILQGGNASIGPVLLAMPDPAGYADGATVPIGPFRTIMNFVPGDQHRGVRVTTPQNYLDAPDWGGGPNPTMPPNVPVPPGGQWSTIRPDGKSWWTQTDSYWNTGVWIDTSTKRGFVTILTGWGGKVYYMNSDVHCDKMQFELHIFDPMRFAEVLAGTRAVYDVEPAHLVELNLPGLSNQGPRGSLTPGMSAGGAVYDPIGKRFYIIGLGINRFTTTNRIYVFQVNA